LSKAVLVDITKCVGCGSCGVACKMWNDLEYRQESPILGKDSKLDAENWTNIKLVETETGAEKKSVWRFVKNQCLHCEEPACASACFSKALQKTKSGPVVYHANLCVGCRYCMIACPFDVPKYEWGKVIPRIRKCQMCPGRIKEGNSPACTEVCPTNALTFGEHKDVLKQARTTISNDKKYVQHIFGEKEAGGTAWLYISDVPFKELGFRTDVTHQAVPYYTESIMHLTPAVGLTWGALLTGMYVYNRRRNTIANEENDNKKGK